MTIQQADASTKMPPALGFRRRVRPDGVASRGARVRVVRAAWWILLLGFSCAAHAQASLGRFHLMADLDGSGEDCHLERGTHRWSGLDTRWEAETDRSRVLVLRRFLCRAGAWYLQREQTLDEPVSLGERFDEGDVLRWSIEHGSLASALPRTLHVMAEAPASGALDVAGDSGWVLPPNALRGPGPQDIPFAGSGALVTIAFTLAVIGVVVMRRQRGPGRVTMLCLGISVAGGPAMLVLALHAAPAGAEGGAAPNEWVRTDAAHDLTGNDPAADVVRVALSESGSGVDVSVSVFDLETQPLGQDARVLMLGNSLTYGNDLPGMLRALAAQAGKTLRVRSVTIGGSSLEDLYLDGRALHEIETGDFDVVVMQQGPSSLPENQIYLRDWTQTFAHAIRDSGARPALYMVWPDASRVAFFDAVRQSYRNAAVAVDGMFMPAGETWRRAWDERPGLALYGSDNFHPSRLGTYAAAATIFASLYRESPEGLPPTLQVGGGTIQLDAQDVAIVQRAAWQTHLAHGLAGR